MVSKKKNVFDSKIKSNTLSEASDLFHKLSVITILESVFFFLSEYVLVHDKYTGNPCLESVEY